MRGRIVHGDATPEHFLPRVYVSGPMTGREDHNFPAFNQAADHLRQLGYFVVNPADGGTEGKWEDFLRKDLADLLDCDMVVVLDDWETSRGARLEVSVARELGVPIRKYPNMEDAPVFESVCQEADRLVSLDRQQVYGHPAEDFARTAAFWTVRFATKLKDGEKFEAEDVPAAMRLLKESRLVKSKRHRDSLTDICGYAKTQEMVWEALDSKG